jgi:hypothetical protein
MKLKKIKNIAPYVEIDDEPCSCVELGIEIDGYPILFGRFYYGNPAIQCNPELIEAVEKFIDEAVEKLSS